MGLCGLGTAGLGPVVKGLATKEVVSDHDITRMCMMMVCFESGAVLIGGLIIPDLLHVGDENEGLAFKVSGVSFSYSPRKASCFLLNMQGFFVVVFIGSWLLWPCCFGRRKNSHDNTE